MTRHGFKVRWINRYDDSARMRRLARAVWQRGTVGDGQGYSVKLTLGLRPALLAWRREYGGWIATVAGLRVHYRRSYGGIHT